ncbi:MAG: hypothetical protein HZB68_01475, partial [Candidatus Aenigmarchaeota archaeon]|nr:hypothetical protein [Candidatus Aenigmarchaeota archaeon]
EKRYDAWFKSALEYPYKAARISELLDIGPEDSVGSVLIEGFIMEKVPATDKDGSMYFVIGENNASGGSGKRVLAKADGNCHFAFTEIGDFVGIAGHYNAGQMAIGVSRFFNKSLAKRLLNENADGYDVHEIKLRDDNGNR